MAAAHGARCGCSCKRCWGDCRCCAGGSRCGEGGTGTAPIDVTVTTDGGTATLYGAFTYLAPTVRRVIRPFGPAAGGGTVTIAGRHFYGAIDVVFGSSPASIVKISDNLIRVMAPPGTGTVQVTVVTAAGTSLPGMHTAYTYR